MRGPEPPGVKSQSQYFHNTGVCPGLPSSPFTTLMLAYTREGATTRYLAVHNTSRFKFIASVQCQLQKCKPFKIEKKLAPKP